MVQGPIQVADRYAPEDFASGLNNISGATNVVRTRAGNVRKVSVNVAGAATASPAAQFYDATAGSASAALAFVIPNAIGIYAVNWPFKTGLNIVAQSGAVLSVTLA